MRFTKTEVPHLSLAHSAQGEVSRPAALLCLKHSSYLLLVISDSEGAAVDEPLDGVTVEPPEGVYVESDVLELRPDEQQKIPRKMKKTAIIRQPILAFLSDEGMLRGVTTLLVTGILATRSLISLLALSPSLLLRLWLAPTNGTGSSLKLAGSRGLPHFGQD